MKKLTILLAIFCLFATGDAYSQFKAGFGAIVGLPAGDFGDIAKFGGGGYLEAKFGINKIYPGVQVAFLVFGRADLDSGFGTSLSFDATTIVPVLITGDYYFVDTKVAPYAGIGIGPYFVSTAVAVVDPITGTTISSADANETEFGFAPRAGVAIGKFNLGAAYHIAGDFDFFAFSLGFLFGG